MQRWVAAPMVEQESYGVREDLAKQPAGEVPEVPGPHPLHAVAPYELRKDGVYPVTQPAEEGTPFGIRVFLLGGVRGQKPNAHTRQLLLGLRGVVITVSDEKAKGGLGELRDDREFVDVGRGHRDAGDHPRPANPHVHPEAIEGLLEEDVLAESGLPAEAPAAVGAGEKTRRQGERVTQGEGRVVRSFGQELLPEALFDLPEVGRLPGEGGPMYLAQGGKPLAIMLPKVAKDRLVGVEPQRLSEEPDG